MFNLIVAVISIALIAILAIASLYYGGTAFSQSQIKAQVTTAVNAGQQIAGANALYTADNGSGAAVIGDLTSGVYLSQSPVVPAAAGSNAWALSTSLKYATLDLGGAAATVAAFCQAAAAQSGGSQYAATEAALTKQFGCVGDATAAVFYYKL